MYVVAITPAVEVLIPLLSATFTVVPSASVMSMVADDFINGKLVGVTVKVAVAATNAEPELYKKSPKAS